MPLSNIAKTTRGALLAYLGPRMALDAQVPTLTPILKDVTARNFEIMIPVIDRRVRSAVRGKLAQDAEVEDLTDLLEAIEEAKEEEGGEDEDFKEEDLEEEDPEKMNEVSEDPWPEAKDEGHEMVEKIKEMIGHKLSPEEMGKLDEMVGEREHLENKHFEDMEEDERWDRRADDARHRLGRDETPEEEAERMESEGAEDARMRHGRDESRKEAEDRRKRAEDSMRRRHSRDRKRAEDARHKMGRDEEPDEAYDRHMKHRAEDRKRALDALDRWCKDSRRKAEDARKRAEDARRRAEDTRHADDRKRADDMRKRAEDMKHRAEDAAMRRRRLAGDEPPDFPGKPETGGTMVPMGKDEVRRLVKQAHDEAVASMKDVLAAQRFVRPWIGEFRDDMAFDTARDVYSEALSALGVKHDRKWPTEALQRLVETAPRPSSAGPRLVNMAQDTAPTSKAFSERFDFTNRVRA